MSLPPTQGASVGAITVTIVSQAIMRAIFSRGYRSLTIARETIMPAEVPSAWIARPMISHSRLRAATHISDPMLKINKPMRTIGRRPKRSDNGPCASRPTENASSATLTVSCTCATSVAKCSRSTGSAGR